MRITCEHEDAAGRRCGRFLGEVEHGTVLIHCPACKTMHEIPITELMQHLEAYLREVEGKAAEGRRVLVGFA